jgi:peptide/nickel transport system substrate-binding protein
MRYVTTTLLIAGLMTALPANAATADNELVIAAAADIRSLNATSRDANTDTVLHHIYETLVGFRSDLSIGPALADSWEISDDGLVYTFHLREDAKFHNGDPVTTADFLWSWDFHMAEDRDVSCRANFDGTRRLTLESIEATDDHTLVFTLAAPNALLLTRLAEAQCNLWAASPDNVDENGEWIEGSAIGSGPFQLESWRQGEAIVLDRFEDYSASSEPGSGYAGDRTAFVDRLTFQIIPDATVRELALASGDVDVINNVSAPRAYELEAQGMNMTYSPGLGWTTILVQTHDPVLSNPDIRRAIAMAIDYEQVAEIRTAGLSAHNSSAIADSSSYFNDTFTNWQEYDPEAARELAASAGYAGELIKIQTNNTYQGMYENAILLQAMLSQAGFNAELETLEWGTQLDRFSSGEFQLQSFSWSARLDPSLAFGSFVGDKIEDPSNQWDNPRAIELYEQSLMVADVEERQTIFNELHSLMAEDIPIIGLYYPPNIAMTRPNIVGFEQWPADNPIGWGISKD